MNNVSFLSENIRLDATIFYPEKLKEKNPAILFIPGWTSERTRSYQYAEGLSKLGYICFLIDLRGHGTSQGNPREFTTKQFLDDVINTYDYLLKIDKIDPNNISAVGSSFGGYLAALLTSHRKVANLVMRVPANYRDEDFEKLKKEISGDNEEIMKWRKQEQNFNATMALKALHNFNNKILIIESEKDDRVPHQTIMNFINTANNPTHMLLKNAPHSIKDGPFKDEVEKILIDWFKENV